MDAGMGPCLRATASGKGCQPPPDATETQMSERLNFHAPLS